MFSSETATIFMNAIKIREGITDLVVNNYVPMSFFHICISQSEQKNGTKVFYLFGKGNIRNMVLGETTKH